MGVGFLNRSGFTLIGLLFGVTAGMATEVDPPGNDVLRSYSEIEVTLRRASVVAGKLSLWETRRSEPSGADHVLIPLTINSTHLHHVRAFLVLDSSGRVAPAPLGPFLLKLVSPQVLDGGRTSVLVPGGGEFMEHPVLEPVFLRDSALGIALEDELSLRTELHEFGEESADISIPTQMVAYWNLSPDGRFGFLATTRGSHVVTVRDRRISAELWGRPIRSPLEPSGRARGSLFSSNSKALVVSEGVRESSGDWSTVFHALRFEERGGLVHRSFSHSENARIVAVSSLGNHVAVLWASGLEVITLDDRGQSRVLFDKTSKRVAETDVSRLSSSGYPERFSIIVGTTVQVWSLDETQGAVMLRETTLGTDHQVYDPMMADVSTDGSCLLRGQRAPVLYGVGWQVNIPPFVPPELASRRAKIVTTPWEHLIVQGTFGGPMPRRIRLTVLSDGSD